MLLLNIVYNLIVIYNIFLLYIMLEYERQEEEIEGKEDKFLKLVLEYRETKNDEVFMKLHNKLKYLTNSLQKSMHKKYVVIPTEEYFSDTNQVAVLALLKSIRDFRPTKMKFTSYYFMILRNHLQIHIAKYIKQISTTKMEAQTKEYWLNRENWLNTDWILSQVYNVSEVDWESVDSDWSMIHNDSILDLQENNSEKTYDEFLSYYNKLWVKNFTKEEFDYIYTLYFNEWYNKKYTEEQEEYYRTSIRKKFIKANRK